jgi:hypothetical protein
LYDPTAWSGHQSQQGKSRHGLATAGFADDPQGLALPQIKAHSIDRLHYPPAGKDMSVEVMHFQDNITNLSRHTAPL